MDAPRPTSDLAADRAKIVAALNLTPLVPPNADDATMKVVEDAWVALSSVMTRVADLEAQVAAHRTIPEWEEALAAAEAQVAALTQERERFVRLLQDAEAVIFEGVRPDALAVTGCDEWDELTEDADEVRWNILGALGIKVVDRSGHWKRLGRAEAAEAALATTRQALASIANQDGVVAAGDPSMIRIPPQEIARRALAATSEGE